MIDLIKYPVLTDKAMKLLKNNQYTFFVDNKLKKPKIKAVIEQLFNVKVVSVNTFIPPRKKRRIGRFLGSKSSYKRVVVTLDPRCTIPFFPTV